MIKPRFRGAKMDLRPILFVDNWVIFNRVLALSWSDPKMKLADLFQVFAAVALARLVR